MYGGLRNTTLQVLEWDGVAATYSENVDDTERFQARDDHLGTGGYPSVAIPSMSFDWASLMTGTASPVGESTGMPRLIGLSPPHIHPSLVWGRVPLNCTVHGRILSLAGRRSNLSPIGNDKFCTPFDEVLLLGDPSDQSTEKRRPNIGVNLVGGCLKQRLAFRDSVPQDS
ncbi:hypothetical protein CVS27_19215 [Arthrobacter glacialis]|uniref:Uncharacterized protein n=1 Tax=Arthrobacter glacialis TaxID=1664 RepID=A0A2S3ZRL5_ARTGL|nr:hypothetical protein CVS27_19215 [Arthrobacter glacialis]